MIRPEVFRKRIEAGSASVTILGAGYVGLPLALCMAEAGYATVVHDPDQAKLRSIERGQSYLSHVDDARVLAASRSKRLTTTRDMHALPGTDVYIICVPTPLGRHREPDLSYVETATRKVAEAMPPGALLILESTTYPGTTRDVVARIVATTRGWAAGTDYLLAFSPEREDPGNATYETQNICKLVGGHCEHSRDVAGALYRRAIVGAKIHADLTLEEAETAKLLENIFRSVNIAMVNELKMLCDRMGIDIWRVIEAAATKPFGFMPFYPGPGLGGHCIPIDPFYLTWKAREYGMATKFIELAGEVNHAMPQYVVDRTIDALNAEGKAMRAARVLVVGVAYKGGIDDTRESPAEMVIHRLLGVGAQVSYMDPMVDRYTVDGVDVPCLDEWSGDWDAAVIVTAHPDVDHQRLATITRLVVDTRNAFRPVDGVTLVRA